MARRTLQDTSSRWQPRAPKVGAAFVALTLLLLLTDLSETFGGAKLDSVRREAVLAYSAGSIDLSIDEDAKPPPAPSQLAVVAPTSTVAARPSVLGSSELALGSSMLLMRTEPPTSAHTALKLSDAQAVGAATSQDERRGAHVFRSSNAVATLAVDSGAPLHTLVDERALLHTLGKPSSACGRNGNCRFRMVGGSLYRSRACNPRRPNWQLLSGLMVSAAWRARAEGRPLPDFEVCMHQGAGPLPAGEGPVLQWCTRTADLLGFPSPYEADCVYKHR